MSRFELTHKNVPFLSGIIGSFIWILYYHHSKTTTKRRLQFQKEQRLQVAAAEIRMEEFFNRALFFPCFFPEDPASAIAQFMDIIRKAKRSLRICVMTISFGPLIKLVRDKASEGVQVQIFTSRGTSRALRFKNRGVGPTIEVRSKNTAYSTEMHNKFVIIDDIAVVTGSLNWSREAIHDNQENLMVTSDIRIVSKFIDKFYQRWEDFDKLESKTYDLSHLPVRVQPNVNCWFSPSKQ